MAEATLRTKLTGDNAELNRVFRESQEKAKEFGREVGAQIREVLISVAALTIGVESIGGAFERTIEGVKGIFEMSKELEHLSDRTGISIKDLVQLQTEFKLSGLEAGQVGSMINKMQRSIENAADKGGAAANVFGRLGINIAELQRMNPADQFELIRSRLAAIEDPARRAQVAMQLFGRSGGEMLALFKNGSIGEEASNALGNQADILSKNSETFQEVATLMEAAGIKIQGFFVGLAAPIGNVILPVLKSLTSLDLTKWGTELGQSIAFAVRVLYNAFETGTLGDLFAYSLEYGAAKGGNFLVAAIQAAFQSIQPLMDSIFANDHFADGLAQILTGAAGQFGAALVDALKLPLQVLEFGMAKAANIFDEAGAKTVNAFGTATRLAAIARDKIDAALGVDVAMRRQGMQQADAEARSYEGARSPNPIANMSFEDFQKTTDKNYFIGTQGADIGAASRQILDHGKEDLKDWAGALVFDLKAKFSGFKIDDVFGAGDAKINLLKTIFPLYQPLPGEGKENAPNSPVENQDKYGDISMGKGLQGIHQGDDGKWSYFSSNGQGAVNFGGEGMAGRAGRIVDNPEGQSPGEMWKQMVDYLKHIDTSVSSVTAPS